MEKKDTIPLWLAVGITVVVSLPLGLWIRSWNLPLWISFCVWAEYFALGAKPAALKTILSSYVAGLVAAVVVTTVIAAIEKGTPNLKLMEPGDVVTIVMFFVGFCFAVWLMKFMPFTQGLGSLPYFQGIALTLGAYFTGQYAGLFGHVDPVALPVVCALASLLAMLWGAFLGWFNIVILFPRVVHSRSSQIAAPSAPGAGQAAG
jgi:hypothetical protein